MAVVQALAAPPNWPLAWEVPYAAGGLVKKKKKKKKKKGFHWKSQTKAFQLFAKSFHYSFAGLGLNRILKSNSEQATHEIL